MALTIWTNGIFTPAATQLLHAGTSAHKLVTSVRASESVLNAGEPDAAFESADVAFGQPSVSDCLASRILKWVEVTSAGYTRYDTFEFSKTFSDRKAILTNASGVFADPCAQHVLSMILAFARQILPSHRDQLTDQSWHYDERRYHSRLLTGQTVLMLGFGAIGRRLAELVVPFNVRLLAFRRRATVSSEVQMVAEAELAEALGLADHVVNLLPDNPSTESFMGPERFSQMKPGAQFYNVGRGTTVDQGALIAALRAGTLGAAYLDVTVPEPLPPEHELWTTPNCFITPHTAGGRHDQDEALVRHFLANLRCYEKGQELRDRVF